MVLYPIIFGIKARTIVFFLISIFLFLIFTMFAWPRVWMKIYQKEREAKSGRIPQKKGREHKTSIVILMIIVLALLIFFAGTIFGFDRAIKSIPPRPCIDVQCAEFDCDLIGVDYGDCPNCVCKRCENYITLIIPVR